MDTAQTITNELLKEFRRRVGEESMPRIKTCLSLLSEEEIWYRPNKNTNSVGNLVLHLCGNARQWILSGLGGQADHRDRDAEFVQEGGIRRDELEQQLDILIEELDAVIKQLTPADLLPRRPVQIYEENGVAILVHVIEHFSYHVGQITYLTKALKDVDTQYYGNLPLGKQG